MTSGKVRNIIQDKRGFIYFVTTAGIERFDGYSLSHLRFPGKPELSALMDQETRACLQDPQGHFWILTDFNGLFEYDPINGEVNHYLYRNPGDLYLIDFILDHNGKNLWIATNKGIARFGLEDRKAEFFLENIFFLTVFEDKEGKIWAGSIANGIHSIQPATRDIQSWAPSQKNSRRTFPGLYCRSIAQDVNGDLLFVSDAGFFRMNPLTKQTIGYFHDPTKPNSFPGQSTSHLLVDSRGQLWIGTFGSGLALFDRQTGLFYKYQRKAGSVGSLADDNIEFLFEDASGQIWVGHHAGGVSFFNGNVHFMRTIREEATNNPQVPIRQINCLLALDNMVWIGMKQGLASWQPATGQLKSYPLDTDVTCLAQLPSGMFLTGTRHGIRIFNHISGRFTTWQPDGIALDDHVLSISIVGDTAVWFSTASGKLWQCNLKTRGVRRFEEEQKLPLRGECNALYLTRAGRLCFGSYGGFCEYDAALDTFIPNVGKGYFGNEGNAVSDIAEDDNGILWISRYGGGLDAFDPKNRRYRHFGTADGLPDKFCLTVQSDHFGRIWVGTENGLAVFDVPKEVFDPSFHINFKVFHVSDGLYSNQVSRSALLLPLQNSNSRPLLFFGGEDGLTELRPELVEYNRRPPLPTLTAFYLFNTLQLPGSGGVLKQPVESIAELVLPPKRNFFTLEFSALNFLSPEKNRYRYLLQGYDPAWVEAGTRHTANYTNVPPGNYTFRLEAFNSDGIASASPLILNLHLLPAWYQTWWFLILSIFAGALVVFAYIHWRLAQLRKMEAMRQAIAADLHDEVGASLTSIQILSQLVKHPDPSRRAEALEKLPEQVRYTSASLREIVWSITPRYESLELLLGELSRHAGEVFEKSGIEYSIHSDPISEKTTLEPVARQHLLRIFKECLNNLVKHSAANRASVSFQLKDHELEVMIRDNGQGFDPATVPRGNGLNNIKQRAVDAGGMFHLRSNPGSGTETIIRLPLKNKNVFRRWFSN